MHENYVLYDSPLNTMWEEKSVIVQNLSKAYAIFIEEQQWYYWTHCWRYNFLKDFRPKVNITKLEIELAYFEAVV